MANTSTAGSTLLDFGLSIVKEIIKSKPKDNVFISPSSIGLTMTMTHHGCRSESQRQLAAALKIDEAKLAELHESYSALIEQLEKPTGYTLRSASRMYVQDSYQFLPEFLATLSSVFKADAASTDFSRRPAESRQEINAWVSEKTEGKIQNVIGEGVITPLTAAVLLNAVYFKGDWLEKFETSMTAFESFYCLDGSEQSVQMMHNSGYFLIGYDMELNTQVLCLPYIGEEVRFVAFIPNQIDGLGRLEERLSRTSIDEMLRQLSKTNCLLAVPRFKLEFECELSDAMKAMGATDIFDANKADLSGIDGTRSLYISKSIHKACIEVNEDGSEAAAATANVMSFRALPPEVRLDRPFFFMLQHVSSGTPLFMGRVVNPSSP